MDKFDLLLYSDSIAQYIIGPYLSDAWTLGRSVRQGCPLSTLLYAIATHPILLYLDHLIELG